MQRKSAKALLAAVSVSAMVGLVGSAKKRESFDPEFERLFTKERVESVVAGTAPATGKALLQKEIAPLLVQKTVVRGDTPAALADRASVTLDELLSVNRLFDPAAF